MVIRIDPKNPKGIVWIASYPKSGNTWVRAFLHALFRAVRGDPDGPVDLTRLNDFSADDRQVEHYHRYLSGPAETVPPREIAAARQRVQADIVAAATGTTLVKTHNALADEHGYPLINLGVSAGAVYVVRNPLDVAVSFAHFRRAPLDTVIAEMATPGFGVPTDSRMVSFTMGTWGEHVRSWTQPASSAVYVVRYEDLHAQPILAFAGIARHLLVGSTSDQLQAAIERAAFDRLQASEATQGFAEKPESAERFFRVGKAGQWREILTADQVNRVVATHGDQMRRFGYLP